ncbi:TetR/AcrR family transcriptional regulator [Christensenella timonensis]|uniref:TetR/AcrR family transcriptional regulator n=1 Tax=Christensenella timonensis TaxID=1816678 RepID=UPI00082AD5FD|nr:TetR/AcrR family transcriptional regulator [Christensenella timonensis]
MPKKIEDVTQKIINAALEIYHKEGYDSLSMRRIAEVSGLAVGTVYTHFEDKEALLAQVLAGEIEQIMTQFMETVFGKEPKEALYGAIYCFIGRMVETPEDVINQVVNFESDKEYIERTLFGIRKQVQQLFVELITRVFMEYKVNITEKDAEVLSELLFGMLNSISLYGVGNVDERSRLVFDMLIAYAEKEADRHKSKAPKKPAKAKEKKKS